MSEFSSVGRNLPRKDALEKVTGNALYSTDIRLPRMLYGKILRSPYPHARVQRIDAKKAEELLGVKALVTARDTSMIRYGPYVEDRFPLAVDKVRFVGEEVAAVAATDEETAEEALNLIAVEYEQLPAVFHPQEALKPGAPQLHDEVSISPNLHAETVGGVILAACRLSGNLCIAVNIERGDIEKGFQESSFLVEDEFKTFSAHQGYIEPIACLASFDASGKLTLWTSSQHQFGTQSLLAKLLQVTESKVRVIQTAIGGSFGGKQDPLPIYYITALLAQKAGRPVIMISTREEEFIATHPRLPMTVGLKMGVSRDGKLTAKRTSIIADCGAYTGLSPRILMNGARRVDSLYRFSNIETKATLVYTNKTSFGAFRGFGNPQVTFALESLMDVAAERLGIDPAEFRLRNATKTGDITVHGWKINSCGLQECIERATEVVRWKEKKQAKIPGHGLGMGCVIHVSDRRNTPGFAGSTALVKLLEDGKVLVISSEAEVGQGVQNVLAQIAAEELGVFVEDIEISRPDTDLTPYCLGPFGDRVTITAGNAVRLASQDAKRQIFEVSSDLLEANPKDLEIGQCCVRVRGVPERAVAISEVAKAALYRRAGSAIIGKGVFEPDTVVPDPKTGYGNVSSAYVFGAQIAEVEVDQETGRVRVLNFIAAHDLGKAINPMAADGQIEGALAQGIGYALSEELSWKEGSTLNPNFLDYKMPSATDVPEMEALLIESDDPSGPYGAKGLGEPGLVAVAPALANAIYDATGVMIKTLPITPDKVLEAIEQARKD